MFNKINSRHKISIILFVVTLIFAGGSVLYFSTVARNSEAPNARLYPASGLGAGGVTLDNVILSKNLVEHKIFSRDTNPPYTPDTWRTPGYPIFVAPFYALFGSFYPVIFVQILILFATAVLIFRMAEKMMDQKWALAVSILYIVLPDTLLTVSALFTESLFVLVLVLAIYFIFFSSWQNLYIRWTLAGFFIALSAYIRPASFYILIFLIPGYFIFYLRRPEITKKHFLAAGFLILAFIGTLAPWYVRNRVQTGVWSFASTGSYVFFRQYGAQFYSALNGIDTLAGRDALLEMAGLPKGTVPRDLKYSAAMQKVAIEVIAAHPIKYAIFHLSSFIPFFTSSGANEYSRFAHDLLPNYNPAPEPSLLQALHPFSFSLLKIVIKNHGWTLVENFLWAIISLLAFLSVWKSKNVRLSRIFLVIVFYFAVVTGPIAHARYRIPAEPLILINAFSAAFILWSNHGRRLLAKLKKL